LLLGEWDGRIFGRADERHMVTVAGSRAGKSSTVLIPNLLRYPGSAIVLDPKGELAKATAQTREAMGQKVYVLDPFHITGRPSNFFNPLSELGALSPDQTAADSAVFADALIIGHEKDPHWTDSAKNLIRGLTLHMLSTFPESATIKQLRTFLHTDPGQLETVFKDMKGSEAFDGIVANTGSSFMGKLKAGERELQGILSTAQEQTAPLADIDPISDRSDFTLADLKRKNITIYLVLPGMKMGTHFRWLRLIIQQAMDAMERTPNREDNMPVLFVLEEFAALGYMRPIETATGFMAGFGVKLWSILQDLTQLQTHYPKSWETFLGNAGTIQAFGNSDLTTTEYLSKRLGQTIVLERQTNPYVTASSQAHGDIGVREHLRQVRLLESYEITRHFSRETNRQIIIIPGLPPLYMNRLPEEPKKANKPASP
jgi:type IV secretion system protein VirD4